MNQSEMDRCAFRINLGLVLQHFESMERLVSRLEESPDREQRASEHLSRRFNAVNAVLLVCANVEEILWLTWKKVPGATPVKPSGGIGRYKAALVKLGIDLGCETWWEVLTEVFTVRDCLLHGNGRPSLLNEGRAKKLRTVLDRNREGLTTRGDKMEIQREYVLEAINAAAGLVERVYWAEKARGRDLKRVAELDAGG